LEKLLMEAETPIREPWPMAIWDMTQAQILVKASKADDTKIDTWMWDQQMVQDFPQLAALPQEQVACVN
jgi:hypothetical protein